VKKFWVISILAVTFLFVGIATTTTIAQDTQNFAITSFDADYRLSRNRQKTALLEVTERIVAKFPDFDQNHGILRAIPKRYQNHTLSLEVKSVLNDKGLSRNYSTYEQNDNLVLKIGDADQFVHGEQTYIISYQMRNVANLLDDHDEFYWDVNGDQWSQSFETINATVHIAKDLVTQLQDRQICYAGAAGSTDQTGCQIRQQPAVNETVISVTTTDALKPYETLTLAIAFNKDTFLPGPEIAREQRIRQAKIAGATAAIALPPAAAFVFMFRRWRQFGDDPKGRGVIVAEYQPPRGLTALSSDFVLQQKLRNPAFSAAIIELAVRRYLTIYEVNQKKRLRPDSRDYRLKLDKEPKDLPTELKLAVELIFGSSAKVGRQISINELGVEAKRSRKLFEKMKDLEDWLANQLSKSGYFIKNPKKVRNGYLGWAGGIFGAGIFLFFFGPLIVLGLGIVATAAIMLLFAFIMPARTEFGVAANDALLGLKDYIKLAEADRLKFGQSPEGAEKIAQGSFDPNDPQMKVKLFETLLPYSILFGLEKDWAKQFANIYKEPPEWYQGNWAAFNTGYLAGSVSSFSAASSQTFVSPSSSSGSGFGGGGGSGGGGGGGGGGGW